MSNGSVILPLIAAGVFGIWWHLDHQVLLQSETMNPVQCDLRIDAKGRETCLYSFPSPFELRANYARGEVDFVREGRLEESFKYSDCSIVDAANWLCRRVHPPSGKLIDAKIVAKKGRLLQSAEVGVQTCYPGWIVRSMIRIGAFPTDYGPNSIARDVLNCT